MKSVKEKFPVFLLYNAHVTNSQTIYFIAVLST